MLDAPPPSTASPGSNDAAIEAIVGSGPGGAVMIAGIATAVVIGLWFAFYVLVFSPRAPVL